MPSETLKPIMVLFPARSGSTLLMQLLATSPRIVFDRTYPFEFRYLSFLLRWSWQLATTHRASADWSTSRLLAEQPIPGNRIEPPPFAMPRGFAVDDREPLWAAAFRGAWQEYCRRAQRSNLASPELHPEPIYYAEKTRSPYRQALQELAIDHTVIYLLRDPRDILMSMLGFNKKRGSISFSAKEGESIEAYAHRFLDERARRLRQIIELVPHDPDAVVVRYEDMVTDLGQVAAQLSMRLGVTLDAGKVMEQEGEFRMHMSSRGGPEASVGRWRAEMPETVQKMFRDTLGDLMSAVGYAP